MGLRLGGAISRLGAGNSTVARALVLLLGFYQRSTLLS